MSAGDAGEWPEVTVAIPAYNLQSYLPDTIRSVQSQDYPGKVRILVLDDGSTDQTLALAQQMAERDPAMVVISQANQGRALARQRLLETCETEFMAWIDADDLATPTWLTDQVSRWNEDSELAAVGGQGYAMLPDGLPLGPIEHPLESAAIEQRHVEGHANAFFQSCVTTKRSKLLQAGGYREKYHAAEDYDLWLRLTELAPIVNVDRLHLLYRVHAASANWTLTHVQKEQGHQILNEARIRRGLQPRQSLVHPINDPHLDDRNRRLYWINIALKHGNAYSGLRMSWTALGRHPGQPLVWAAMLLCLMDTVTCLGNRTKRFVPGQQPQIRTLPRFSAYRLARWAVHVKRRFRKAG